MRTELTELAARQADWLAVRQQTIATNVANAGRTDYGAGLTVPFANFVQRSGPETTALPRDPMRAVMPSRNTVDLAGEMVRGGEVARAHSINTAISGAFHRMTLAGIGT